ncbi:MAG: hypothetical protein J5614_07500 [Paludibacteraceae bacterium]|nr:hypothetical protein [Paludibacteraceae bacterium]
MSDGFCSFSPQTPFIKCQFISKSWKSGNFSRFYLGKMEIFGQKVLEKMEIFDDFTLEKWKFSAQKAWKSGNFERNLPEKVEIIGYNSIFQQR